MPEPSLDTLTRSSVKVPEKVFDIEAKDAMDRFSKLEIFSSGYSNEEVRIQQELSFRVIPLIREKLRSPKESAFKYISLLYGINAPNTSLYEIFKEAAFQEKVYQNPDGSSLSRVAVAMLVTAPSKKVFIEDATNLLKNVDQGPSYNRAARSTLVDFKDRYEEKKSFYRNTLSRDRKESRERYEKLYPDKLLPPERTFERIVTSEAKEQRRKATILRQSSALQALFQVVRNSEVFPHIEKMLERAAEYRKKGTQPESRFRDYTAFFAALATDPQGSMLLETAIDRHIEHNSKEFRKKIKSGNNYIPMVIIGSGPHSAAFAAEYQRLNPDNPPLILEKELRSGGNFPTAEVGIAYVNSRNRPEPSDKSLNLPGKSGNLNSLGNTVIQLPDISTEQYPPLSDLGRAIRINHLFNNVWSGIDFKALSVIKPDEQKGTYKLTATDQRDKKQVIFFTDRVVDTSGLGKENTGLDEADPETSQILAEELLKEEGAQVLTFQQFTNEMGKGKNVFPLRGYKDVAVIGSGDSGKVVTELLLAYGPGRGLSVPNLDFTENVYWFGQKAKNKKEYLAKSRLRYVWPGLDFQRDETGEYYYRIKPIPEMAQRLRRTEDGKIKMIYTNSEGTEEFRIVDHVIIAAGFKNETSQILEDATTIKDSDEVEDYFRDISNGRRSIIAGTIINYSAESARDRLTINEVNSSNVTVSVKFKDGSNINNIIVDEDSYRTLLQNGGRAISVNERPTATEVITDQNGNPIAQKYINEEIYRAGPAATLPLGPTELIDAPAIKAIPENTASLFRYIPKDLALADLLAKEDIQNGVKTDFFNAESTPKIVRTIGSTQSVNITTQPVVEKMHHKAPYDLMLKMAIADNLHGWKFPKSLKKIALQVTEQRLNGKDQLTIKSSSKYDDVITTLFEDSTINEALHAKIKIHTSKSAILTIPLSGGKVIAGDISLVGLK